MHHVNGVCKNVQGIKLHLHFLYKPTILKPCECLNKIYTGKKIENVQPVKYF